MNNPRRIVASIRLAFGENNPARLSGPTLVDLTGKLAGLPGSLSDDFVAALQARSLLEHCFFQVKSGYRFEEQLMLKCAGYAHARWHQALRRIGFVSGAEMDEFIVAAALDPTASGAFLDGFLDDTASRVGGMEIANQIGHSLYELVRWLQGETAGIRREDAQGFRRHCERIQMRMFYSQLPWSLQNRLDVLSPVGARLRKFFIRSGWTGDWKVVSRLCSDPKAECRPSRTYSMPPSWDAEVLPHADGGSVVKIQNGQPAFGEVIEQLPSMYAHGVKTLIYEESSNQKLVDVEKALHSYLLLLSKKVEVRWQDQAGGQAAYYAGVILADLCEALPLDKGVKSLGVLPLDTFLIDMPRADFMQGVARGARNNCKDPQQKEAAGIALQLRMEAWLGWQAGLRLHKATEKPLASAADCQPFGRPLQEFLKTCAGSIEQESLFAVLMRTKGHRPVWFEIGNGPTAIDTAMAKVNGMVDTAKRENAAYLVVTHAVPCSAPQPSLKDRVLAKQLAEAGKWNGICVPTYAVIGTEKLMELREFTEQ